MDKSGLSISVKDGKNVLRFNGKTVESTFDDAVDRFGVCIKGQALKSDGVDVAVSAESNPSLRPTSSGLDFGGVNISESKCVNITLADYNKLLKGERVTGYAMLNGDRVYNIVTDVATASPITYTDDGTTLTFSTGVTARKMQDTLYNNVSGGLTENTEDLTATMVNKDCPFVNLRCYDPIVPVGGKMVLEYYVDNKDMDSLNSLTVGDTFTLEVKLANGTTVKKTTYAGFNYIELTAINTAGETWFSVRCIDERGVASVEQHIDILVRNEVVKNHYVMVDADLETYGIVLGNNDPQVAFANKAALSSFFAAVKEGGYNGVKMLNRTYWIDYHATFGTQRYWRVVVRNNRLISVDEVTEQDVISNGYVTTTHGSIPVINGTFGDAVVMYFVVSGSYYECSVYDGKITSVKSISASDIPSGKTATNKGSVPYVGEPYSFPDAAYTLVYNTSTSGANIVFPNEFTVDLNGATIAVTQCNDLNHGAAIRLNGNYDTHIVNGNIVGNYDGFDFATTKRRYGVSYPSGARFPGEGCGLTSIQNYAKYCSLERLNISGSVGYELTSSGNYGTFRNVDMSSIGTENTRISMSNGQQVQESGMISSDFLSLFDATRMAIGRTGQGSYSAGTERELFFSFYDENKEYLSTVKTKMYYIVKVPTGAKYVRVCGYGTEAQWPYSTGAGIFGLNLNPSYPTNITVDKCSWQHTRTCALTIAGGNGIRIMRSRWKDIALESGTYQLTKILGDIEDGWQRNIRIFIGDCTFETGAGSDIISMTYCNKIDMYNCTGFTLRSSGIEDGFVTGNRINTFQLGRDFRSITPHVIYKDNIINSLAVTYENSKGNTFSTDDVDVTVPMVDCIINNTCTYKDLVMRNGKNGATLID